ncbi:unnamed protein product [Haemonchus placei]|uniref:UCH domain-containing protein n=1 Tax=Haemonchus placei TaxID=6290 RepID=A0A158QKQ2_HAEPC|nr:unnamed protein product [Haemonchus placei]
MKGLIWSLQNTEQVDTNPFAMDIRVIDDTEELVMPEELKDLGEQQAVSRALGVLIHALLFHEPCVTLKPWERRRARPSCLQATAMWSHMQVCSHCDAYAFLKEVTGYYDEQEPLKTVLSDAFAERVARQLKAPHHFILDADTGSNKCAVEVQTDISVFTDDIVHVFAKSPPHVCVFFAEPRLGLYEEVLSDYNKEKRHVGIQVDNMPRDCCMTCGKFNICYDGENSKGKSKKGGRKGNKGGRRNKKSK